MLSDSIFESVEKLWDECIVHYDYSDKYKEQLIDVITDLRMIMYELDTIKGDRTTTRDHMRTYILEEWDQRIAAAPPISWRR